MLDYHFYPCDEGSKTKNLKAGTWLLQRYEMWAGVANKKSNIGIVLLCKDMHNFNMRYDEIYIYTPITVCLPTYWGTSEFG